MTNLTIRPANSADADRLRRLAALDSQAVPRGDLLVGVVDGEIRAARSTATGDVIADPFVPTADLVRLLAVADTRPAPRRRHGYGRPREGLRLA